MQAVASPSSVGACLLSSIQGNSPGLTLPGPTQYDGLGQARVCMYVLYVQGE